MRRVIVHESIAEDLVDRLVKVYKRLPVGNPFLSETLVGPFVDPESTWSNVDLGSSWMPFSVTHPATGAAGTNATFQIRIVMDDGANTDFFFDNLSFLVNVCQ